MPVSPRSRYLFVQRKFIFVVCHNPIHDREGTNFEIRAMKTSMEETKCELVYEI